jgi:hypothetical protein
MKRIVAAVVCLGLFSIGLVGCDEKSSVKTETKVTTPSGSKTVTHETKVSESGKAEPEKTP